MTAKVKLGDWLTTAWNLLTEEWQTWCLISFVYFIPIGIIYGIAQVISFRTSMHLDYSDPVKAFITSFGQSMTINLVMTAGIMVAASFFLGGMYRTAFRQLDGEPISVAGAFSGFDLFPKILVVSAVSGILQFMAAFLCYFPMFIVQGLFFLALPMVVRRDTDPMQVLSDSYQTTKSDWIMFAVLALVASLLSGLGALACLIGLLFSYPLLILISAVAYKDIFESPAAEPMPDGSTKACRSCGTMIPSQANFCNRCGAGQV